MNTKTLYYIYDPMCSWCWGFKKTWNEVKKALPGDINIQYVLGGLAPDNNTPMPKEMQQYIQENWLKIQQTIPGTEFNNDFWLKCQPKRSTYPACRAVIATKNQNPNLEIQMVRSIQKAYYLKAQNPSEDTTLINLAISLNLNIKQFTQDLNSKQTQQKLNTDIALAKSLTSSGFPSLLLRSEQGDKPIRINYNNADIILKRILA